MTANLFRRKKAWNSSGFSLLEVVVGLALITLLAAGILQSVALIASAYRIAEQQRREVLRKWNASRHLRLSLEASPELVQPPAGGRPLYRHEIRPQAPGGLVWEVWLGER